MWHLSVKWEVVFFFGQSKWEVASSPIYTHIYIFIYVYILNNFFCFIHIVILFEIWNTFPLFLQSCRLYFQKLTFSIDFLYKYLQNYFLLLNTLIKIILVLYLYFMNEITKLVLFFMFNNIYNFTDLYPSIKFGISQ